MLNSVLHCSSHHMQGTIQTIVGGRALENHDKAVTILFAGRQTSVSTGCHMLRIRMLLHNDIL